MDKDRLTGHIKGWKQEYYGGKTFRVCIPEIGEVKFTFWDRSGAGRMMLGDIDLCYKNSKPYIMPHMPNIGGVMRLSLGIEYNPTIEVSELALLQYPDGTKFIFWDEYSETQNELIIVNRESTNDGGFIFTIKHKVASPLVYGTSSYKIKIMDSIWHMDELFEDMDLTTKQLLDLKVGDIVYTKPNLDYYLGDPKPHNSEVIYKDIEVMVTKHTYHNDNFYNVYFLNYGYNTVILPKK